MPYQLSGQAVVTKSVGLPHGAGEEGFAAADGGAFVAMSSAIAALKGVPRRNEEMPITQSEVRFMAIPQKVADLFRAASSQLSHVQSALSPPSTTRSAPAT